MQKKKIGRYIEIAVILLLCGCTLAMDFFPLSLLEDEFRNKLFCKIIQQSMGSAAGILLMITLNIRLFGKIHKPLYLIPCLLVAVDNFQWSAFFNGKMELVRAEFWDIALYTLSCLAVGLFEELIFRGVLFSVLASLFKKDRKGIWATYVLSSVIFGGAHLFNGFSLGTIVQVLYTVLTGGLFAFCLMKTKNILCCALVHGVYNFGGTLFDTRGLGSGVVFDIGTVITMLIVSVAVGLFVLYKIWKYSEEEREALYQKLGV